MSKIQLLFKLLLLLSLFSSEIYGQDKLSENFQTSTDSSFIIIPIEIDGRNYNVLFDTGSRFNLIYDDGSGSYNFKKARKVKGLDSYNNQVEVSIIKKKIKIPSLNINMKSVVAIMKEKDRPEIMKKFNIDGVLGADIINNYDWEIDYHNLKITRLTTNFNFLADSLYMIKTHIDKQTHQLSTNISINNDTIPFIFDTGMNSILTYNIAKQNLQNEKVILKSFAYEYTIAGKDVDTSHIGIKDIFIGNIKVENIPILYPKREIMHNAIGSKFLKVFGKIYILNSIQKILLPTIESYQYRFKNIKEENGIIVSQRVPFESKIPSYLGKKIDEIQGLNKMEYKIPQTKYSFKSKK